MNKMYLIEGEKSYEQDNQDSFLGDLPKLDGFFGDVAKRYWSDESLAFLTDAIREQLSQQSVVNVNLMPKSPADDSLREYIDRKTFRTINKNENVFEIAEQIIEEIKSIYKETDPEYAENFYLQLAAEEDRRLKLKEAAQS